MEVALYVDVEKHLLSLPVVFPKVWFPDQLSQAALTWHSWAHGHLTMVSAVICATCFLLSVTSENPGLSLLYQAHLAAKALLPDFHLPGCWDGDEPLWEITSVHMSHIPGPPA